MSGIQLAHKSQTDELANASPPESPLERLNERATLTQKVEAVHNVVKAHLPFVERVAADVYEARLDLLETVVESSPGVKPWVSYQTRLEEASAVRAMLHASQPGVMVHRLGRFRHRGGRDPLLIPQIGYASNCTMPMYDNGSFFGFLYFSSHRPDVFDAKTIHTLDVFGHLISLVIIHEYSRLRVLTGTIKAARAFTLQRDPDTGSHIDRMAHYVRLIANHLAVQNNLSQDYVDKLFLFAPLHDVGKIAIPDSILLKPGNLTPEEFEVMKTHTIRGRQLVDELIADFSMDGLDGVNMLRNIATFHHEAMDGSGYPLGMKGDEIPLEARITAAADVFDALTSKRPYKQPMSNEQAFVLLEKMSGSKLDPQCVRALASHQQEIVEIQQHFTEDAFG